MNIDQEKIKTEVLNLTSALGFDCQVDFREHEGVVFANIMTDKPGMLIGRDGEILFALQQIVRIIVSKKDLMEARCLILDVNNYHQKRFSEIEKMAKEAIEEVLKKKTEKTLPPMNSMERMLVHKIVSSHKELISESFGQGPDRHVVIKFRD
jgi:spoIIIJ-associated protein